ncbi:hypothetical protein MGG_09798 [Pyricularia oryzae 70-15]|uniref:Uncharacterized protein n=3 Tax=Pyricularia oryzae TaxID=318829 RepID=G4NIL7_PYRO7|nr:uncharacterized protein MGG_09798 [Pyricularia oryzae 70-15]EHA48077.1 hypothetical protein MGG_09798 [Pyricularia oryzae 70-15]ELQ42250.1 hypothetical protein OOU_Y34scaffold00220g3 [Pyricularia oryzae Y34]KAI7913567.1 hypothetical protein M0657_009980 [Pyricularia oryzae]
MASTPGVATPLVDEDKSLASEISGLEESLASIATAHEKYHESLAAATDRLDTVIEEHVSSVLPPLRELIAAARYFWAGMIDAQADQVVGEGEGDQPDEEDVERALREIEKSVAVLDSACETGLRLLTDDDLGASIKTSRVRATGAYNAAFGFWKDCDSRRIPEARQLLEANMQTIAALEKKANAANSARDNDLSSIPSEDDTLGYKPLSTAKAARKGAAIIDGSVVQSQVRSDMKEALTEHQTLAQSVTKLVCQGTHLKLLRNELRGQDLLGTICEQRLKTIVRNLERGRAAATSIIDVVKKILGKLEFIDAKDEGDFPVEDLLGLSARLIVHLRHHSTEERWALSQDLVTSLKGQGNGQGQGLPLPLSVTEILSQIESPRPNNDNRGTPKAIPNRPAEADQNRCAPLPSTERRAPGGLDALAPMPYQEEPATPPPPQLQIMGASWAGKDVTATLASRVKDNKLVINMHNIHTILGDPMPYKYKILTGLYRYGDRGEERLFIISEQLPLFSSSVFVISPPKDNHPSNRLSIPVANNVWQDPSGGFEIVAVTYGPRHVRNEAVLADFADYFAGRKGRMVPDNGFFRGDPWPGQDKTWTVFVRFAGSGRGITTVAGLEGRGLENPWASL